MRVTSPLALLISDGVGEEFGASGRTAAERAKKAQGEAGKNRERNAAPVQLTPQQEGLAARTEGVARGGGETARCSGLCCAARPHLDGGGSSTAVDSKSVIADRRHWHGESGKIRRSYSRALRGCALTPLLTPQLWPPALRPRQYLHPFGWNVVALAQILG